MSADLDFLTADRCTSLSQYFCLCAPTVSPFFKSSDAKSPCKNSIFEMWGNNITVDNSKYILDMSIPVEILKSSSQEIKYHDTLYAFGLKVWDKAVNIFPTATKIMCLVFITFNDDLLMLSYRYQISKVMIEYCEPHIQNIENTGHL